ncbi:MAG TPA: glycosyltransferase family 2 protein [Chitinophagaceae bacterium]|nr:glycosyltransferase family 2 protein [Chitinophagaceae bacterium]
MTELSVIVPVFNEAESIVPLYTEIEKYCPKNFELIWVDDGSTDTTFTQVQLIANSDNRVKCVSLSRNFGHQNALRAGLNYATGKNIITMDGDLQHPPSLIPLLLDNLSNGYDIVLAQRKKTVAISPLKRFFSASFYKFINLISDVPIEENVSDFRGFNRKVLNAIKEFEERDLFLRGLFSWVGFKKIIVQFEAPSRKFGKSKYSYIQMFRLALKGTTSFSFKPLRISILIGSIVSLFAFSFAVYALFSHFNGKTVTGWTSIIIAVMLFGGIQLLAIGLLGEYIAGMFTEVKKRPIFLIKEKINIHNDQ